MFAKTLKLAAVAAITAATMVPAAAEARPHYGDRYAGGYYDGGGDRGYYQDVRYRGDRGYYRGDRGYRGGRGGYYGRGYDGGGRGYYRGGRCRDKGTGGTIIGAIAGGLLGNEIGQGRYNRGDGTAGAIVGAGVGALAGRAIDRNC
jgi:hypothetical protein